MRRWILVTIGYLCMSSQHVAAQPKIIPPPPEFQKLVEPKKFDPVALRDAIAFPISSVQFGVKLGSSKKTEVLPSPAVIEKKLVGDERDAEWLLKLGTALTKAKAPEKAKQAFEKSVAAYRRRIEKEPHVAKLYLGLSDGLYELDQNDEAHACAKKCVAVDPRNAEGWKSLHWYQWQAFLRFVCGDEVKSWNMTLGSTPPKITKNLSAAERAKAQDLLLETKKSHEQWKRLAPDDLDNFMYSCLIEGHWEIYDTHLRRKDLSPDDSALGKGLHSKKMSDMLLKFGHDNEDPPALCTAYMLCMMAFRQEAGDPDWTPARMTAEQKKTTKAIGDAIRRLVSHRDKAIASKAHFGLIYLAMGDQDVAEMKRLAFTTLAATPSEPAAIELCFLIQSEDDPADRERFWLEHLRKHPSVGTWSRLGADLFKNKKYANAERCFREAEKLDPGDKTMLLGKAVFSLRRGPEGLVEAGKILDALEKRVDEPEDDGAIIVFTVSPKLDDSCRYLRTIHTALSGKWEQGRDALMELREREVLVEAIGRALEAFPPRPIVLPLPPLGTPTQPPPVLRSEPTRDTSR